jgi:putative transcriptional regulator
MLWRAAACYYEVMEFTKPDFTHQLLIAMPGMADPRFARALTYVFKHDDEGAIGLVVNKPLALPVHKLLSDLGLPSLAALSRPEQPVLYGGPVQPQMGFVLHREAGPWSSCMPVAEGICVTNSRDILDAIAQGHGPGDYLVALGYAGWSAGQLEGEMAQNAWLTCNPDDMLLFSLPLEQRWQAAADKLGVDIRLLSDQVGHA